MLSKQNLKNKPTFIPEHILLALVVHATEICSLRA